MVQNKDEIERQTRSYLTVSELALVYVYVCVCVRAIVTVCLFCSNHQDALEAVVKDIELVAANLTQYVDLQANCVDSLTSQLDMVRTVSLRLVLPTRDG